MLKGHGKKAIHDSVEIASTMYLGKVVVQISRNYNTTRMLRPGTQFGTSREDSFYESTESESLLTSVSRMSLHDIVI